MTLYLTGVVNPPVRPWAGHPDLGVLYTPDTKSYASEVEAFGVHALDNACFSQAKRFSGDRLYDFYAENAPGLFATAPDRVGLHEETLARSRPWFEVIRSLGHKVAFVVQNGATVETVPWDEFDVLFVGGVLRCEACDFDKVPTAPLYGPCQYCRIGRPIADPVCKHCQGCGQRMAEWKESDAAVELIREAQRREMWVHVGRVNGGARFAWCEALGVDSCDGTYLKFGRPGENLPKLLSWLSSEPELALAA